MANEKGGKMEVGVISAKELPWFETLLLPQAAEKMRRAEPVTALGLVKGQTACGAAAGYIEDSYFLITSFYVAPDYRRQGGGRLLMETLVGLLEKYGGMTEMRIRFTVTLEEHRTLLPFLSAVNFSQESALGKNIYIATLKDTVKQPFFSKAEKTGRSLAGMDDVMLAVLERSVRKDSLYLPPGGLRDRDIDRDVSMAAVSGDRLMGVVIADHSCGGLLTLAALWCRENNPMLVVSLLRSALERARKKYPPETRLAFQAVTPVSVRLIRGLVPDAEPISHAFSRPVGR